MSEEVQESELTVEDILSEADEAPYHTILEIWREVLKPAIAEANKKITPQWAQRITSSYRELTFKDMDLFRDDYFARIGNLATILDVEIATDDECLNLVSPEEDVQHNGRHYLNLLVDWQKQFMQWELDWECTDPYAAIELASIAEVHRMFFDSNGLTNLLDQINFEVSDADREMLTAALEELRVSAEG
jgi:cyclopropane fatty-acyl-phospholipid synthase-like methyltransferase